MAKKLLLLFIPFLFNGCKDDEETFWYSDVPDKTVTSMIPYPWTLEDFRANNIWYTINENYNAIIWVAWSTTSYDMNQDEVPDFSFEVQHFFQMTEEGKPPYDEFLIYIKSIYNTEISLTEGTDGYVKKYTLGDALDYNSFGKFPIHYRVDEGGYLIRVDLDHALKADEEFYVAVKTMKHNRAYYGWFLIETTTNPLTLTVKEYALSKVGNRKITVGER